MILGWKITDNYWAKLIFSPKNKYKKLRWKIHALKDFEMAEKYKESLEDELKNNLWRLSEYILKCEKDNEKYWGSGWNSWDEYKRTEHAGPKIKTKTRSEYVRKWMKYQNDNLTDFAIRRSLSTMPLLQNIDMSFDINSVPQELINLRRNQIKAKRKIRDIKRYERKMHS